jgi:hypothetical protein
LGGGITYFYRQAKNNAPDKVFADALQNSLQTKQVQIITKSNNEDSTVGFDLSTTKNPIVFSKQSIKTNGSTTSSIGYGDTKNSYFKYSNIPNTIQPDLRSALLNANVMVRQKGSMPVDVPGSVMRACDPLYRMVGPVLVANLDEANAKKISKYLLDSKAYQYSKQDVVKQKYNGKNVLAFNTKMKVGDIMASNQSVVITMGFYPYEVEGVINSLQNLSTAKLKIYVGLSDHRLVATELTTDNDKTVTSYNNYNKSNTPIEPQTKLSWVDYADAHYKMQSNLASTRPPSDLDSYRKARLIT